MTVQNPCLSGGAIEIFLEPVLPAPRVLVVGDTPIAGAVLRLGAELGLDLVTADGAALGAARRATSRSSSPRTGATSCARCAPASRPACPTSASSPARSAAHGVVGELRGDGVAEELIARIDVPAGIDIGARTPGEIALSILARIVEVRRQEGAPRPAAAAPGPRDWPSTRSAG